MDYIGIIEILGNWEFVDALIEDEYASWTREQAEVIFDHMEERAQHEGGHIELDLASIRGEYDAYDTVEDALKDKGYDMDEGQDEMEQDGDYELLEGDGAVVVFNPY